MYPPPPTPCYRVCVNRCTTVPKTSVCSFPSCEACPRAKPSVYCQICCHSSQRWSKRCLRALWARAQGASREHCHLLSFWWHCTRETSKSTMPSMLSTYALTRNTPTCKLTCYCYCYCYYLLPCSVSLLLCLSLRYWLQTGTDMLHSHTRMYVFAYTSPGLPMKYWQCHYNSSSIRRHFLSTSCAL